MAHVVKISVGPHGKPYEVRWSAYRSATERVHRRQRFRTEREAKAKKREIEQAIADAALPNEAGRREEFAALAERWFRAVAIDAKPTTARGYRAILDASVLPAWGPRRVGSITTADVRDWMLALFESGKAAPTVVHHLGTLRRVLALAVEERTITINPATGVRLPKDRRVSKPEPRFLTAEEVARVAAHLDEHAWPYGLLVTFAAYTGLRAGELAGLNIGDVDPLRALVHVRRTRRRFKGVWEIDTPKSGKGRRVPMPEWLAGEMAAYMAEHPRRVDAEAPLWPGRRAGGYQAAEGGGSRYRRAVLDYDKPFEPGTFYKRLFQPALNAVGLPSGVGGVRLHDLRHTYASLMASFGVPILRLSEYMGHGSVAITQGIYTHLYETDTAQDMRRVPRPPAAAAPTVTPIRAAREGRTSAAI